MNLTRQDIERVCGGNSGAGVALAAIMGSTQWKSQSEPIEIIDRLGLSGEGVHDLWITCEECPQAMIDFLKLA